MSGSIRDVVVGAADGTVDFYYQVTLDSGSESTIFSASRGSFAGLPTDVDRRLDQSGTVAPSQVSRTLDTDPFPDS